MQCVLLALIREPDHDMCRAFVHMCVSTLTTYSEPGAYRSSNKASTFNLHWTSTRGSGFSYTEGHLGQTSPFSLAMLEDGQVIDRIRALLQPGVANFWHYMRNIPSAASLNAVCAPCVLPKSKRCVV